MDWQNQNGQPNPGNNPYGNNNPYQNQNPYHNNPYYPPYRPKPRNEAMATAAMVTGILAVVTFAMMTVYLPFIFGSISILLALLSKGRAPKLPGKAKIGILCSITGVICNIILVCFSLYMVIANPMVREQVDKVFEAQYGITIEEMYEDMMNGENPYDTQY